MICLTVHEFRMICLLFRLIFFKANSYIAKITRCLCDPCEVVRRQTFILLSRLLQVHFYIYNLMLLWRNFNFSMRLLRICYCQRDYVKWRGVLFLRFLLSLVDESEKIRQLADFLFGNILKGYFPSAKPYLYKFWAVACNIFVIFFPFFQLRHLF